MHDHRPAIQDTIHDNACFGCGPAVAGGLRIRSHWTADDQTECRFRPETHMTAGPAHVLNGGVIATVIDCHAVCTAIAEARRRGDGPHAWYATGSMSVRYLRPAGIGEELVVTARLTEVGARKTVLSCTARSGGEVCAEAEVIAVRVPAEWTGRAA